MISSIRNPWIRRSLLIAYTPFYTVIITVCHVLEPFETYFRENFRDDCSQIAAEFVDDCHTIRNGWRGPKR